MGRCHALKEHREKKWKIRRNEVWMGQILISFNPGLRLPFLDLFLNTGYIKLANQACLCSRMGCTPTQLLLPPAVCRELWSGGEA